MSRWFQWLRTGFLVFILGTTLAPGSVRCQSLWIPRDRDQSVLLEILKPGLEYIDEDTFTAAFFLDGRFALGPNVFLVGEIPFSRFAGDYYFFVGSPHRSEAAPGKVYLGVEIRGSESPFFGEFGVRLPTSDENEFGANLTGSGSDRARVAFGANNVSVHAAVNLREVSASGIAARLRLGTILLLPTESNSPSPLPFITSPPFLGRTTELLGVYAWQIGYERRVVRVGGALSGMILFTDDRGNLGERSTNQLEFHSDFGPWRVRPGIELRLPLDSAAALVPVVLGVSVSAGL